MRSKARWHLGRCPAVGDFARRPLSRARGGHRQPAGRKPRAMSTYLFDPPPVVTVPIEGRAETFPVRRILCVGRNYAAHRREMGGDDRDPPFFFAKPADAVVPPGEDVAYPPKTSNLH